MNPSGVVVGIIDQPAYTLTCPKCGASESKKDLDKDPIGTVHGGKAVRASRTSKQPGMTEPLVYYSEALELAAMRKDDAKFMHKDRHPPPRSLKCLSRQICITSSVDRQM